MQEPTIQYIAAGLFAVALIHTFAAKQFERLAHRVPRHAGLFHLLGEVEVVFGFWAIVLMAAMAAFEGPAEATNYVESRNYTEPLFVFAIMVVAGSRPVLYVVQKLVHFVTEPAAMTIAALILGPVVFRSDIPEAPKYVALGVLFVNISIGGTLSAYAAPPVLMVAKTWGWDTEFMLANFGWKAALAVVLNA